MKTMLYCQHSIGMGHLIRTLRLAEASLENGPVRLICGGEIPAKLQIDARIQVDALPPLIARPDNTLADPHSASTVQQILQQRCEQSLAAVNDFEPDALIVEMFPFGRKKFADEILGLIKAARDVSNASIFSSVRDVLVTSRRDQTRYEQRVVGWLNRHFDALLIHADPRLVTLNATFSDFSKIEVPTYYTGYISSSESPTVTERDQTVVVSAGGGRVGQILIDAAINAWPEIKTELGLDMLVVTGPMSKGRAASANSRAEPKKVRFLENMPEVLGRSSLSISQCGYNTAIDVLKAQIPAVFVPFETASEDEQLRRAALLAGCGRSITLREFALNPRSLTRAARQALAVMKERDLAAKVDLDGARCSRKIVNEWRGNA